MNKFLTKAKASPVIQNSAAFFNFFTIMFLVLALWAFTDAQEQKKEWAELQKNGVCVDATITDIIYDYESDDSDDHAIFSYSYEGKEYSYDYDCYPDGLIIGKTVTAYILPDAPENLVINTSGTNMFFFWFLSVIAVICGVSGVLINNAEALKKRYSNKRK